MPLHMQLLCHLITLISFQSGLLHMYAFMKIWLFELWINAILHGIMTFQRWFSVYSEWCRSNPTWLHCCSDAIGVKVQCKLFLINQLTVMFLSWSHNLQDHVFDASDSQWSLRSDVYWNGNHCRTECYSWNRLCEAHERSYGGSVWRAVALLNVSARCSGHLHKRLSAQTLSRCHRLKRILLRKLVEVNLMFECNVTPSLLWILGFVTARPTQEYIQPWWSLRLCPRVRYEIWTWPRQSIVGLFIDFACLVNPWDLKRCQCIDKQWRFYIFINSNHTQNNLFDLHTAVVFPTIHHRN